MEKKSFVREWMELRGFNPHSLSQIAGIGRNTLYRYFETLEGGRYKPKKAVADALGVSIEQLRFPPPVHPLHHLNSDSLQAPLIPGQATVVEDIVLHHPAFGEPERQPVKIDGKHFKRLSDTIFIMESRGIFEIPDIMMKKYLIIKDLTQIDDIAIIEDIHKYVKFAMSSKETPDNDLKEFGNQ